MAAFYSDECFTQAVVDELRRLGHDILTARDAGRVNLGLDDADVLAFATSHGRSVLTHNVWDYVRLHRQAAAHAGIICCTRDADAMAAAARIHSAVEVMPSLYYQLVRINKPP